MYEYFTYLYVCKVNLQHSVCVCVTPLCVYVCKYICVYTFVGVWEHAYRGVYVAVIGELP